MVCAAIEKVMKEAFLPSPTEETWREVAQRFWDKWNFPNCIGAIDGKHVHIQAPPRSGSQFNYKKAFSVVVLALADADYRFRVIQVSDFERTNDIEVYTESDLARGMESRTLHVPDAAPLPGAAHLGNVPFAMVGDVAFPLKPYLMRPYPAHNLNNKNKKIFNYRLSRARRAVENAFIILASRWRILHQKINLHPQNVGTLVVASCILHNFLLAPRDNQWMLDEAEKLRLRMSPALYIGGNRAAREAYNVREAFTSFFNSPEGGVSWQDKMV